MSYRLGVDVGGTFTDFALLGEKGDLSIAKVLSDHTDVASVILEGLRSLAQKRSTSPDRLLKQIDLIVHGTTIATNAVIQQKMGRAGLIATKGFRDILELREGLKENRYDYSMPPPKPLVPRQLRLDVRERVNHKGQVLISLEEADVINAAAVFRREGVESVAVCLLWSIRNPRNEQRIREILQSELPGVPIFLSSDVAPQIREYPRFSTTALSAALAPLLNDYLSTLEANISKVGFDQAIRYIQCNGGTASGEMLRQKPVLALDSGPAAGPAAALFFARLTGNTNVITLDMGGTSLDVSMVFQGRIETAGNRDVHRYRVSLPMVNVRTIGAGGGSIAHLDNAGMLHVGPQSAESHPGPACYNRGGTLPTVTDANVALGYFSGTALLGGKMEINREASMETIAAEISDPLGISLDEAAHAIYSIVNENMANAVRAISSERGHDIRDFSIVCGGGCSPAHAASIADAIGVNTVIVPRISSVLCSFGAAITDVRHDYYRDHSGYLTNCDFNQVAKAFQAMQKEALAELSAEGFEADRVELVREMDLRYLGEIGELRLAINDVDLESEPCNDITALFHHEHETIYTFFDEVSPIELMGLNLTAYGKRETPFTKIFPSKDGDVETSVWISKSSRNCCFAPDTRIATPVYDGATSHVGDTVCGPAIIEEETTTILVPPRWSIELSPNHAWVMTSIEQAQ